MSAFKLEVELQDLFAFEKKLDGINDGFEQRIVDMLNIIGWQMHADAVEMIIRGPRRTGNKYMRGGREATRSAYGEPAKNDTGNLQSSLHVQLRGAKSVSIGYLRAMAPYGEELENPAKLNRPVLSTVKAQNITYIRAQIRRTVRNIVKL